MSVLPIVTPEAMREAERAYFAEGRSSFDLMERAASEFAEALDGAVGGVKGLRVRVACGRGNNGGDGFAAARLLKARGADVIVEMLCASDGLRGDAKTNFEHALAAGVPCVEPPTRAERPDIWVDAVFGIGLNRAPDEACARLFDRVAEDRAAGAFVAAVDMPSGCDALTGRAYGAFIEADLTVTFGAAKQGQLIGNALDACGRLAVRPIGVERLFDKDSARLVEPSDARALFPKRRRSTHKGDYGRLLIVAGSVGMAGAAAVAASAAIAAGCGLTTVACPASVVPIVQTLVPCAMCAPMPEENGAISDAALSTLSEAMAGKDALAVGPGLSRRASRAALGKLMGSGLPAALDADALNLVAESRELRALLVPAHVLTPHPGEAARLLGRAMGDPFSDVRALRTLGATALLKGAVSLVCGATVTASASGSPGMAKGGSGDALTGIIGALLARGVEPETAAWAGSELHGLAGERAAKARGEYAMTALDLAACIPDAILADGGGFSCGKTFE